MYRYYAFTFFTYGEMFVHKPDKEVQNLQVTCERRGSKQKSDPLAEFWIQLQGGTRLRTPTQSTQSHQLIHFLPSSTLRLAEPGWTIALRVGELGVMVECPKFEGWMVASDPLRSNVRVICLIKLMFCDVL